MYNHVMASYVCTWWGVALLVFVKMTSCQENDKGEPLVLKDFHSYALNMGSTLVDLLRREVSMLGKISPAPASSEHPGIFGSPPGPPPAAVGVPLLPPGSIYSSVGSLSPSPVLGPGTPAAAVTATAGSTVYSIGTNYAPLTVINIYKELPPDAIPDEKDQKSFATEYSSGSFQNSTVTSPELINDLKPIGNVSSSEIPNNDTDSSPPEVQQTNSTDTQKVDDLLESAGEESKNTTSLAESEGNDSGKAEPPVSSSATDDLPTEENVESTNPSVPPSTTE